MLTVAPQEPMSVATSRDRATASFVYQNLRYLLLKAQRMVATRTELVAFRKVA